MSTDELLMNTGQCGFLLQVMAPSANNWNISLCQWLLRLLWPSPANVCSINSCKWYHTFFELLLGKLPCMLLGARYAMMSKHCLVLIVLHTRYTMLRTVIGLKCCTCLESWLFASADTSPTTACVGHGVPCSTDSISSRRSLVNDSGSASRSAPTDCRLDRLHSLPFLFFTVCFHCSTVIFGKWKSPFGKASFANSTISCHASGFGWSLCHFVCHSSLKVWNISPSSPMSPACLHRWMFNCLKVFQIGTNKFTLINFFKMNYEPFNLAMEVIL